MNSQMQVPQVDILIIAYNQEKYIFDAIYSAINQTYKNTKIIVADDCSTDSTRLIIDDLYQKYPDKIVKVYNDSNLGITVNSNKAIAASNGKYMVIMGGDDILYPEKIYEQVNWFDKNPKASLCGHELDLINEESRNIGDHTIPSVKKGSGAYKWIRYGMLFGCISIMIKKDENENLHFDDRLLYASDLKFFIDFLGENKQFGFIKRKLGAYRKVGTSITSSKWEICVSDSEKMYDILTIEKNSRFKLHIIKGKNYSITYGYALRAFNEGNYRKAIFGFLSTIKSDRTNFKAYYRLMQSIISSLINYL